ncbi:hypothetical protein C0J52_17427 [Blattella germanica]|nr:hypothetical protein C0J52_17427 [Blattella germanica]
MRLVLKLFYSVVDVAGAALQRNCSVPLKLLLQTGSVAVFSGLRTKMAAWVVARESHRKNIEEVEDSLESACQSLDNTEVGEEDVLGFQESAEIPRTPTPQNHPRPSLKRKKTSTELQEQAVISSCMSLLSKRKPKDEFSIFGDFVASEIRNLKNAPDLQWKLKRAIQGSILEISDEYAQRTFPHASPISVSELSGPSSIIVQQVDSNYDALSFKL